MKTIEIVVLDAAGFETDRRDFDSIRDARKWVRECGRDVEYWDRRSESPGYASRNVATIQLVKNGECVADWFPTF